jgi:hypothetical protein
MMAVGLNNMNIINLLLENKASIIKRDSFGKSALIYAI